jgi:dihydrolipoyl dehydrogenase
MAKQSFDCVVIGSGPGGYVAAIRAAQLGMKTAVVEKDDVLGGRCLNYACIPAKSVLRAADVYTEVQEAGAFGIQVKEATVDFAGVAGHRDQVIKTLTGGVGMLFDKNKVDVVKGQGSLTADGSVAVGKDQLEAKTIVLATGSVAKPVLGLDFSGRVLDTAAAWLLEDLPGRMAVIGAGASGTEIASAYGRLGTEVLLLEALPQILPLEDKDVARTVAREIAKQNVRIVTDAKVESVEPGAKGVKISFGGEQEEFEYLAIAAGRGADVEGLGLEEVGVEADERGLVKVDAMMRTSRPGVYAIGDLIPGPALAHKASDEGIIAVEHAAGMDPHPLDYDAIPAVTFCQPQVASFGLTEEQAKDAGYDVVAARIPLGAVGAPTVYGEKGGLIKIVAEKKYGELLGGHIVSVKAADLIQELVQARHLEGGFSEVARTIHAHPTYSEAVMEAARAVDGWLIHG